MTPAAKPLGVSATPLLEISGLHAAYGDNEVLRDVSLTIEAGDVLGVVGESGSGKTTLGLAVLGLLPAYARTSGSIQFEGRDLGDMRPDEKRRLRGERLSAVFQNPMTSLDPSYRIGDQIVEVLRTHRSLSKTQARERAIEALREVGIAAPEARMRAYPHELSGGMNQRAAIAVAMALNPSLLIADEPTSALDVTVQAQILRLLRVLIGDQPSGLLPGAAGHRHAGAVMLITHDLGVVAQLCNRVVVVQAGEIVEQADVRRLFRAPAHPYTQGLLASLPARRTEARA